MLTESYNEEVHVLGHRMTLAEVDVALRAAVLLVCLCNLVLNILDLVKK